MYKKLPLIITAAVACASVSCFAQDAKPKAAPFKWAAPLRTFKVSPSSAHQDTFDVNASLAPISDVLQSIAAQSNLHVIISDDVKTLLMPNISLRQVTGPQAIEAVAARCDLVLGKVGQDTYLVVLHPALKAAREKAASEKPS